MAVNLSTVQLHHAELPRVVNNLLQIYRLPPRSLELEVTETGLMEDISTAAQHLLSLRRSGRADCHRRLRHRLFIAELPEKPAAGQDQDRQELRSGPARRRRRCHHRSRHHPAGQEPGHAGDRRRRGNRRAETYIISEGCHEGQGYHYSKPLPARELTAYLKQAQRSNAAIL
jgi:hypothetical protein